MSPVERAVNRGILQKMKHYDRIRAHSAPMQTSPGRTEPRDVGSQTISEETKSQNFSVHLPCPISLIFSFVLVCLVILYKLGRISSHGALQPEKWLNKF